MNTALRALLACTAAFVVFACAKSPAVGTWKLTGPKEAVDAGMGMEMTFDSGTGCSMSAKFMGESHTGKGTYKVSGKTVTVTPTESDGKKATGTQAEPKNFTLSDDGKTMTATDGGVTMTFTKQ